jgi:hypothetical protein
MPRGREVAACGFKFGSPAGSALVGCEMAGGSEEGNESSSVLSSSLSRSLFLFRAACPAPRSSRCKSSLCLLREILPPQCFAILVSPVCGKNAWPRARVPTVERFADGRRITLTRAQPLSLVIGAGRPRFRLKAGNGHSLLGACSASPAQDREGSGRGLLVPLTLLAFSKSVAMSAFAERLSSSRDSALPNDSSQSIIDKEVENFERTSLEVRPCRHATTSASSKQKCSGRKGSVRSQPTKRYARSSSKSCLLRMCVRRVRLSKETGLNCLPPL